MADDFADMVDDVFDYLDGTPVAAHYTAPGGGAAVPITLLERSDASTQSVLAGAGQQITSRYFAMRVSQLADPATQGVVVIDQTGERFTIGRVEPTRRRLVNHLTLRKA